jgi:hypothetical protein
LIRLTLPEKPIQTERAYATIRQEKYPKNRG